MTFIGNSAERMNNLVQGILEYGRLGKNKSAESLDLNEIVKAVRLDLGAVTAKTGADFTVGDLPTIVGFRGEVRLLFQNLIVNALKFRDPDKAPKIEIGAEAKNGNWLFHIRDNGIGMDAKFHSKVFKIFQRLHLQNEYLGTGIGLANCKKIVDMHQGDIWLDSKEGSGTTFYFTLPAPRTDLQPTN